MIYKVCTQCDIEKDQTHFNKHKLGKQGLNPVCRSCRTERQRKHRTEFGYGSTLKSKYGITYSDYLSMLEAQQNKCTICGDEFDSTSLGAKAPCVDHCHVTGKVRSILCRNCNTALGHVKENVDILKSMIAYVEDHHAHM